MGYEDPELEGDDLREAPHGLQPLDRDPVRPVDLEACRQRGVSVAWTPEGPSDSVAELTVGLLVCLLRQAQIL